MGGARAQALPLPYSPPKASDDGDAIWQFSNCVHIVVGKKAPEKCPVCDHPKAYFQKKAENY